MGDDDVIDKNHQYEDHAIRMFKFCRQYFIENGITKATQLEDNVQYCRHFLTRDYLLIMGIPV